VRATVTWVLVLLGVIGGGVGVESGDGTAQTTGRASVLPVHPYALATAPDGDLYIIDVGRDQVLRLAASERFEVVAGDGKVGFSGDSGPAVDAELSVESQSGIVVGNTGGVYFSDSGNGRVREIEPNGTIRTVAGGGDNPLGTRPVPAPAADIGPGNLYGLTIGPAGELYLGTQNGVYRLSRGVLSWVVGLPYTRAKVPANWGGVYSNPAIESDFMPAARLAFDGTGDLLVAGGGGFGLYVMSARGHLRFLEIFRGDGSWGSLATGPGGTVEVASRAGLARFSPNGRVVPLPVDPSSALGQGPYGHPNIFIGGDGLAVGRGNRLYVDTNTGNTFTSVSAILEVVPTGRVIALWRS
jgi:hypothetical protein